MTDLSVIIDAAWEDRANINFATRGEVPQAVDTALAMLDAGSARVAEPNGEGGWKVNQWLKKAVLLSFRLNDNELIQSAPGANFWFDKRHNFFPIVKYAWSDAQRNARANHFKRIVSEVDGAG